MTILRRATNTLGRLLIGLAVLAVLTGCNSKPPVLRGGKVGPSDGAGVAVGQITIDRQSDLEAVKTALLQLDATDSDVRSRDVLSVESAATYREKLGLDDADIAEVSRPTFNTTDAYYVYECLMFSSAVSALEVGSLVPPDRAARVFEWLCRNMFISDRFATPSPAYYSMCAGTGPGIARAYAVCTAWQQAGLVGAYVGPKEMAAIPSWKQERTSDGTIRGAYAPILAVGVWINGDWYLFDHLAGKAMTNAKTGGPLTLKAARGDPSLIPSRKSEEVSTWSAYLSIPRQALSPRMKSLEVKVGATGSAKLFIPWASLAEISSASRPWNVAGDQLNPSRVHVAYQTERLEGLSAKLHDQHLFRMAPMERMPQLELFADQELMLKGAFAMQFVTLRSGLMTPGEQSIRGQFRDATNQLTELKSHCENARTRMERDKTLPEDFRRWTTEIVRLQAQEVRAKRDGDTAKMTAAQKALQAYKLSHKSLDIENTVVRGMSADLMIAEINFLLALTVHERAERSAMRGNPEPTLWKSASEWWDRYLDSATALADYLPQRNQHARGLKAIADERLKALTDPKPKKADPMPIKVDPAPMKVDPKPKATP